MQVAAMTKFIRQDTIPSIDVRVIAQNVSPATLNAAPSGRARDQEEDRARR
jgi:hypothetical protein